jgi:hypothetical protein
MAPTSQNSPPMALPSSKPIAAQAIMNHMDTSPDRHEQHVRIYDRRNYICDKKMTLNVQRK